MRVIPPIEITAALLTSSTLVETTPAVYNAGTAYSAGDIAYRGAAGDQIIPHRRAKRRDEARGERC